MPKGDKRRKKKDKKRKQDGNIENKRVLPIADEDQVYAKIIDELGNRRFKLDCSDSIERIGILRGSIKSTRSATKRYKRGDWVLAALREYQVNKADIFEKLDDDEVKRLHDMQELYENTYDNNGFIAEETEKIFSFDDI